MTHTAIIGAGGSAEKLVSLFPDLSSSQFFTSAGTGTFCGKPIQKLEKLNEYNFSHIIIAIWDYEEILPYLQDLSSDAIKIEWFDAINDKRTILDDIFREKSACFVDEERTLTVIYDLRIAPPTFDFLHYLMHCDFVRREKKLDSITVIIAPGDNQGFRTNIDFLSAATMYERISKILIPLSTQLECKVFPLICNTRPLARDIWNKSRHRFPEVHHFKSPYVPYQFKDFVPKARSGKSIQLLKPVDEFYKQRITEWADNSGIQLSKSVSITLRESTHHSKRNSNLPEWLVFASLMKKEGYEVIFVRDTERCFESTKGLSAFHVFDAASIDFDIRRSLYQSLLVNFFTNNGVASLGMFDKNVPFILNGMIYNDYGSTHYQYFENQGFEIGVDHFFFQPNQKLIWQEVNAKGLFDYYLSVRHLFESHSPAA